MTPRPPAIRTKAETALADAFTQSRASLPGGDAVRGVEALRRCLSLRPPPGENQPGHAHVHHRLAELLERQGRGAEAAESRAAVLRLEPDFRAEKTALRN